MFKILIATLLIISYIDTIKIATPTKGQVKGYYVDIFFSFFHTLAYGLAASVIIFGL